MPKVSVIVPVYQVEHLIERLARSLFDQSMKDAEYIFVDDKSADGSVSVLQKVLDDYPDRKDQVHIVCHDHNCGAPKTRQTGFGYAKGEYILFCDSDDLVEDCMLEHLYDSAIQNSSDIVIFKMDFRFGDKVYATAGIDLAANKAGIINDMLLQKQSWSLVNKLFKRSLFDNPLTHPSDNMGDDMTLTLQLTYYAERISFLPEVLYHYEYNPASIINTTTPAYTISKFEGYKRNYGILRNFYADKPEMPALKHGFEWLEYNIKNTLFVPNAECLRLWRSNFRGRQFKVLFMPGLDFAARKLALRLILRSYYYCIKYR